MDKKTKLFSIALASALGTGTTVISTDAQAGAHYCKGISMKYVNGCQANGHECQFKAKKDWDPNEWLPVNSKADCDEIKKALKHPAIKKYIETIRDTTVVAIKRGKKL